MYATLKVSNRAGWRHRELGRKVPVLRHFRRADTKRHDGTVVEHGGGFMLEFDEPEDAGETAAVACGSVAVADILDILVIAERSLLSGRFVIGWRDWTFTDEPLAS